MLFAETSWERIKPEQYILEPGVTLILEFVEKAGANPLVFMAMSQILFYFPQLFIPKGLIILADHQSQVGGTHLFSNVSTVFYLERVMQRVLLYRSGFKIDREKMLILLNAMIETGSSTAYFLRERLLHSGLIKGNF